MPSGTVTPAAKGGSTPGASIVRGPLVINAATDDKAALASGVAFYTPTVGDILLEAWFEIDTVFNAAAAADISQYTGTGVPNGLFGWFASVDLTNADTINLGGGPLEGSAKRSLSLVELSAYQVDEVRIAPSKFITADPLQVVVSSNGNKGAAQTTATAGIARLFIVTATPVSF